MMYSNFKLNNNNDSDDSCHDCGDALSHGGKL